MSDNTVTIVSGGAPATLNFSALAVKSVKISLIENDPLIATTILAVL